MVTLIVELLVQLLTGRRHSAAVQIPELVGSAKS
jgi:hypothetical protein